MDSRVQVTERNRTVTVRSWLGLVLISVSQEGNSERRGDFALAAFDVVSNPEERESVEKVIAALQEGLTQGV